MYKKMMKTFIMVALIAFAFGSLPAMAEEESDVSGSGDISFLSQYVWRGFAYSDSSIVVQPSATIGYKGFSFNIWGNLDMDNWSTNESEFNEVDLTLSYDMTFDALNVGVGYIYYGLDSAEDSQEIYISLAYDGFLSPSLTVYKDIDSFPGWYGCLGIAYSIPLGKIITGDEVSLDLAATVAYADYEDYSEWHDGNLSASITFPVNDNINITPMVSYSYALKEESRDAIKAGSTIEDPKSDYVYGGITCSISF